MSVQIHNRRRYCLIRGPPCRLALLVEQRKYGVLNSPDITLALQPQVVIITGAEGSKPSAIGEQGGGTV